MARWLVEGVQELCRCRALEWPAAGQRLHQHHRYREEVRALVHGVPEELFRRHVPSVPMTTPTAVSDPVSRSSAWNLTRPRSSSLTARPPASPLAHDVVGLEIAVNDPVRVRGADAVEDLIEPFRHDCRRHRVVPIERRTQREAVEPLHDEIRAFTLERSDVVHGDDVRMIQLRGGARFAPEAAQRRLMAERAAEQHLDRHRSIEPQVARLVDRAHPAFPNQLIQPVCRRWSVRRAATG